MVLAVPPQAWGFFAKTGCSFVEPVWRERVYVLSGQRLQTIKDADTFIADRPIAVKVSASSPTNGSRNVSQRNTSICLAQGSTNKLKFEGSSQESTRIARLARR
ncbi:hypothetical protein CC2G_007114 [Coprinopsis cinerea AmutBmut pab1-1]|nr:hypothetical protein CC2G_007114 [Coprinopsis cinerea AmutBmut pab1-1]